MFSKNVYCSPIVGTITWGKRSLSDITLVRNVVANGLPNNRATDKTKTDAKGDFNLPEVSNRTVFRPSLFASHLVINQFIDIVFEGNEYNIWAFGKNDYKLGSETGTDKIRLVCDLSTFEQKGETRTVFCKIGESE